MNGTDEVSSSQKTKLVRLARLPRLYRLIRLLRMLKMLRVVRKSSLFKEFTAGLNFSVQAIRMLNTVVLIFIMNHLMTCFWYMAASLQVDIHQTWVG